MLRKQRQLNTVSFAAVVVCWAALATAQPAGDSTTTGVDWPKLAPGDAGFYVEIQDLAEIRRQFSGLGIWATVREISERDLPRATTRSWKGRTEAFLGLSTEASISLLLGRRTALVATAPARWQDGIVLAELAAASDLDPLLRQWRAAAQPDEGPVRRYQLHGGILLAVLDRTLAFGPAGDPDGLWGRTVQLLAGQRGPTLAGRAEFAGLRSRLSQAYPVLAYAVWPPGDPMAMEGCSRLLVGAAVDSRGIRCEVHGHREATQTYAPGLKAEVIRGMPADSLAVGTRGFDFLKLGERLGTSEPDADGLLPFLLTGLAEPGAAGGGLGALGPACGIVIGVDGPTTADGVQIPAVTALVEAKAPGDLVAYLDDMMAFLVQLVVCMATPEDQQVQDVAISRSTCEDVQLHYVQLGPALAKRTGLEFLGGVRPCWAVLDGRLVVSTSLGHVEQIVKSARRKGPRLDSRPGMKDLLPTEGDGKTVAEWVFARGPAIAETLSSWLKYIERHRPEALKKEWWEAWAAGRSERRDRLGVGLSKDTAGSRRALVIEVRPDSPAAGILEAGDVVVGVGGAPLTTTQPAHEVAQRYRTRGTSSEFELNVLRGGDLMNLKIPVSPAGTIGLGRFDPIGALRQLIVLSRSAETVTLWRYATPPDRLDARVLIRWRATR